MGTGRGLEGMFEPADRETAEIAVEQSQVIEHPIGQAAGEGAVFAADDRPVICRAVLHLAKAGPFSHPVGNIRRNIGCGIVRMRPRRGVFQAGHSTLSLRPDTSGWRGASQMR